MAIDILSIPAMSSEPDSKILLSDSRNRLGDDVIEACECLKAWEREGFLIDKEIMAVETMLNDLEEVFYS
ncbi:hypothetical protein B9Z19DRAFT_1130740 [Tuber borchii]|uniref:HAT C-terminal dimerisation domain-containing protein n=1 Tax=Tuber borchii TaxID=42251 RepID=A0A2T6ZK08_TUBBO|nr:hypothetical protein B9Z19DRAFT_1130740 [Tuber borchii]